MLELGLQLDLAVVCVEVLLSIKRVVRGRSTPH